MLKPSHKVIPFLKMKLNKIHIEVSGDIAIAILLVVAQLHPHAVSVVN